MLIPKTQEYLFFKIVVGFTLYLNVMKGLKMDVDFGRRYPITDGWSVIKTVIEAISPREVL